MLQNAAMDKNDPNAVQAISPGKLEQAVTGVKVEAPLPGDPYDLARKVCSLLALVAMRARP